MYNCYLSILSSSGFNPQLFCKINCRRLELGGAKNIKRSSRLCIVDGAGETGRGG